MAEASYLSSLKITYETFALSVITVWESARGYGSKERSDDQLAGWSERIVDHARMRITVRGREHMAPGQTYVIMSNHQSFYDIPVLFYALGSNLRMVAKAELLRLPFFGPALRAAGFIMVNRKDHSQAITSLRTAATQLAHGTHIWISPEGTRSPTGALAPFKKGGFVLAMDAGLPILPVTLRGTRDALLAHSVLTHCDAEITVTLHPPIPCPTPAASTDERRAQRDALMNQVRSAIAEGLVDQ